MVGCGLHFLDERGYPYDTIRGVRVTLGQRDAYFQVMRFWRDHFRAPSQREVGELLGDISHQAVFKFMSVLREKGLLTQPRACERKACARSIKDPATKIRFFKKGAMIFWM